MALCMVTILPATILTFISVSTLCYYQGFKHWYIFISLSIYSIYSGEQALHYGAAHYIFISF